MSQRFNVRVRVERSFDLLSSVRSRRAGEHTNSVISAVCIRDRLSEATLQPTPGVFVFGKDDETATIPVLPDKKIGFDPIDQPSDRASGRDAYRSAMANISSTAASSAAQIAFCRVSNAEG